MQLQRSGARAELSGRRGSAPSSCTASDRRSLEALRVRGRRFAHRLSLRGAIDGAADWFRFKLDNATAPHYQPLPWGWARPRRREQGGGRDLGLEAMQPIIVTSTPESALDVICTSGGIHCAWPRSASRRWASRATAPTIKPPSPGRLSGIENVAISVMALDVTNVRLLREVDCTLFLPVCTDIAQERGLSEATFVLRELWQGNPQGIVFETAIRNGAGVRTPDFEPDACSWFRSYLSEVCQGAVVHHLGIHHGGEGARPLLGGTCLPCFVSQ